MIQRPDPEPVRLELRDPAIVQLPGRSVSLHNVWTRHVDGRGDVVTVALSGAGHAVLATGDSITIDDLRLTIDELDEHPDAEVAIRCSIRPTEVAS